MKKFSFNTTPGIRFGDNAFLENINEIKKCVGENVLFVTDQGIIDIGLADTALSALNNICSKIVLFNEVEADPSLSTLERAIEIGKKNNCSGVIGFGGGSSMDVAKLSALIMGSKESLDKAW